MKQSQNARRGRSRPGPRKQGKQQDSNRNEIKVRGNPKQLLEKYTNAARDAMQAGDRVLAEHNHQFADHYQRVINEMRGLTRGLFSGDYIVVERAERPERQERYDRSERSDRSERHERSERGERTERPSRGDTFDAAEIDAGAETASFDDENTLASDEDTQPKPQQRGRGRGRGRPARTAETASETDAVATVAPIEDKPKPRGRPRRRPVVADGEQPVEVHPELDVTDAPAPEQKPRRRGRPPRRAAVAEEAPVTPVLSTDA